MKKIVVATLLVMFLLVFAPYTDARVRVRGYTRSNGTYVMPHYRTNPNRIKYDNWSAKGNTNPYSGKKGYVSPFGY